MDGFEKLGQTLSGHMSSTFEAKNRVCAETGVINADFSLQIPRFTTAIPKEDYRISKGLCVDYAPVVATTTGGGEGPHTHSVTIKFPDKLEKIKPGDEVLVMWIGNEPVIAAVLEKGSVLGK